MLTIIIASLVAVGAVSAADNVTDDVVSVEQTNDEQISVDNAADDIVSVDDTADDVSSVEQTDDEQLSADDAKEEIIAVNDADSDSVALSDEIKESPKKMECPEKEVTKDDDKALSTNTKNKLTQTVQTPKTSSVKRWVNVKVLTFKLKNKEIIKKSKTQLVKKIKKIVNKNKKKIIRKGLRYINNGWHLYKTLYKYSVGKYKTTFKIFYRFYKTYIYY